jgi:hypothetical protein
MSIMATLADADLLPAIPDKAREMAAHAVEHGSAAVALINAAMNAAQKGDKQ